eukprot:COSAG06_NODE_2022_length_7827_cov_4.509058_1_plen_117_part_00
MDEAGLLAVPVAPEQMSVELPNQDVDGRASRNKGCCSEGQLQLLPVTFGCMCMHTTIWFLAARVSMKGSQREEYPEAYYHANDKCHPEDLQLVPWYRVYVAMGVAVSGCGMSCSLF